MKKYFLAVAVLLVWGIIAYKLVDLLSASDEPILVNHQPSKPTTRVATDTNNYALQLNYPDPFLGKEEEPIAFDTEPLPVQPAEVQWPNIGYLGNIQAGGQLKAIVQLDQTSEAVKQGDMFNEVRIVRIYNDSILVKYQNQTRTLILTL